MAAEPNVPPTEGSYQVLTVQDTDLSAVDILGRMVPITVGSTCVVANDSSYSESTQPLNNMPRLCILPASSHQINSTGPSEKLSEQHLEVHTVSRSNPPCTNQSSLLTVGDRCCNGTNSGPSLTLAKMDNNQIRELQTQSNGK